LILSVVNPELLVNIPVLVFIFSFGCCAGSFINVLVYRLPRGLSIVTPPSKCPSCETKLTWRENFPVFGWLLLRGRCRFCRVQISPEYPLVEFIVGCMMAGLFVLYFMAPDLERAPNWAELNDWFRTWPVFTAHLFLIGGLVAMTLIDARTFIIPLQIPWAVTAIAFVAHLVEPFMVRRPSLRPWGGWAEPQNWAIVPTDDWTMFLVAVGGCVGLLIGIVLLQSKLLRRSFEDYDTWERGELERLAEERGKAVDDLTDEEVAVNFTLYPHARREMVQELFFLAPCMFLMALAAALGPRLGLDGLPPAWAQSLGGALLGYLVGGGVVWGTRILGSLGFGKEAMGLGDVHLMAAVGAVLGWPDAVLVFFFAAPFIGILLAMWKVGVGRILGSMAQPLPYGPSLAVGTLLVLLAKPEYEWLLSRLLKTAIDLP
jgi:leader peptidase (prepilin peptidase)/N-methyltransferase